MLFRTALAAAVLVSLVPTGAATRIRLAPAEGLALRKTFESVTTNALESMTVTVHGEEQEQDQTSEQEATTRLVVVDRYVEVGDERVTKLERSYEDFEVDSSGEMSAGGEDHTMASTAESELSGHAVTFTWDQDEEAYAPSSEDEDVDSDWLEDLEFDLDFLGILPGGEVEVGDEWEVDAEALRGVLRFERGLPMEWEHSFDGEVQDQPEEQEDEEAADEETDGDLTATFEALREEDGVQLAVIRLSGEYTNSSSAERSIPGEQGSQTTVSESVTTVELEGECLWDVAGGHLRSCEITAELGTESSSEVTLEFGDQTMEFTHESATAGTLKYTATFERAE